MRAACDCERIYVYLRMREGHRTRSAKMRVELLVLMLFVCMAVGEFFFQLIQVIYCVLFLAWQVRRWKREEFHIHCDTSMVAAHGMSV